MHSGTDVLLPDGLVAELSVVVEQRHIDEGVCGDPWGCPVYLAAKEAGVPVRSVGKYHLIAHDEHHVYYYDSTRDTEQWIKSFDREEEVQPFKARFVYESKRDRWY